MTAYGPRPFRLEAEIGSLEDAVGLVFKAKSERRKQKGDVWLGKGGSHGDTFSKDVDADGNPVARIKRSYGKIKPYVAKAQKYAR